jgi:acylphosphatase
MSNKRLHAIVSGYVQGVSFRYYTRLEAQQLGLTGWVVNRPDGTLEVVADGPQRKLQALARFLLEGPPLAEVRHVQVDWLEPAEEHVEFVVLYL